MNQADLAQIVKILDFTNSELLNRHLDVGWILLGISSDQAAENHFYLSYSVGWSKANGDVKYPEKTDSEIRMEKWTSESSA